MLNAIGEATMQHTVRANYDSEIYAQDLAAKKSDQVRKQRPVEKAEDSSKSKMQLKQEEDTRRKNTFEDGDIIVEEYDETGQVVRKTPPGYVLTNEMV
jgi:hypothetical protein